MDARFRRDPVNRATFMQILQQPRGIIARVPADEPDRVLGRYLRVFRRIVGQMQHDLFHVYTVDQHILMVLRNVRRFSHARARARVPVLLAAASSGFDEPWLLYVAALFHDIAKGRGGDHSELGAREARSFCRDHGIAEEDARAGRVPGRAAPDDVARRAEARPVRPRRDRAPSPQRCGNERHLTALYLLTVADIRGTSPKVWNAWKGKLLEDLYRADAARRSAAQPLDARRRARGEAGRGARLLRLYALLGREVKNRSGTQLDVAYFLRHDAAARSPGTRAACTTTSDADKPVVRARLAPLGEGLQVLVYTPDQPSLFARICGYFDRAGFNILDAKIHTTRNGYALDTFLVMSQAAGAHYRDLISLIETRARRRRSSRRRRCARRAAAASRAACAPSRSRPRSTSAPTSAARSRAARISPATAPACSTRVARVLARYRINLQTARIKTLGERVEDVFLVSGEALSDSRTVLQLEQDLLKELPSTRSRRLRWPRSRSD